MYFCDLKIFVSTFSLNVDSITRKWDQLKIFIDDMQSKNLSFCCIMIQEARISKEDCENKVFDVLPGYKLFAQEKIASEKGGLLTYLRDDFSGTVRKNLYKK